MNTTQLSDVQRCNLTVALLIREAVLADPGAACCRFGLDSSQLEIFRQLTPDAILSSISSVGHQALFSVHADLGSLLKQPSPLQALVASAQPRSVTRSTRPAAHPA